MSRIGYYYRPDSQHYRAKDLERWLPVMRDLAAGWTVLRATDEKRVPGFFIKTLLAHGVQPIIHLPEPNDPVNLQAISEDLRAYADIGVEQIVVLDQLNSRSRWSPREWSQPGIVERAARKLLPILEAELAAGLQPIVPPLQVGGDYWDLPFLEGLLSALVREASQELSNHLGIACYGWDHGRGARWGAGGPAAWPQARPYVCPPGSENQVGVRSFEWYGRTAQKTLGYQPPVFVIAGGRGPKPELRTSPEETASTHAQIITDLGSDSPDWLKCFCFYALTAGDDPRHRAFALAAPPSSNPKRVPARPSGPDGSKVLSNPSQPKSLRHYLLLPRNQASDASAWENAKGYVQAFQPAVGFSPEEAALAERVTLAGGEDTFPVELEESLRSAGAIVERLTLRNSFSSEQRSGHAKRLNPPSEPRSGACDDPR